MSRGKDRLLDTLGEDILQISKDTVFYVNVIQAMTNATKSVGDGLLAPGEMLGYVLSRFPGDEGRVNEAIQEIISFSTFEI